MNKYPQGLLGKSLPGALKNKVWKECLLVSRLAQCRSDEMEKYLLRENEMRYLGNHTSNEKKKKIKALQTHFLASHHFLEFSHLLK